MKKFLLLFVIFQMMNYVAQSQPTNPSHNVTCVPTDSLRLIYTDALRATNLYNQLKNCDSVTKFQTGQIISLERMAVRDSLYYRGQLDNKEAQNQSALNSIGELNRSLKRERLKRKLVSGVSGGLLLTLGYLLIKK